MKNLILFLSIILFAVSCSSDDDNSHKLTGKERQEKIERLSELNYELSNIKAEISSTQESLQIATGGVAIVLREQLQNLMHRKGEIEREIQRLKKELNL